MPIQAWVSVVKTASQQSAKSKKESNPQKSKESVLL
jgi:hypothetical protein